MVAVGTVRLVVMWQFLICCQIGIRPGIIAINMSFFVVVLRHSGFGLVSEWFSFGGSGFCRMQPKKNYHPQANRTELYRARSLLARTTPRYNSIIVPPGAPRTPQEQAAILQGLWPEQEAFWGPLGLSSDHESLRDLLTNGECR